MTTLKRIAGRLTIAALLLWSWLDTRTYTGPESPIVTRWRLGAFAVMIAGYVIWSRRDVRVMARPGDGDPRLTHPPKES